MGNELIERLAKESGALIESWMTNPPKKALYYLTPEGLEKFAALVAEECAKAIDVKNEAQEWCFCGPTEPLDAGHGYDDSARIIRAKFPMPE